MGDPAGMRSLAARVEHQADLVGEAGRRVDRAAGAMVYNCPAGDDLRLAIADRRRRLARIESDLAALGRAIVHEAADLEATQQAVAEAICRLAAT